MRGRYGFKDRIETMTEDETTRARNARVAGVCVKPDAVTISSVVFPTVSDRVRSDLFLAPLFGDRVFVLDSSAWLTVLSAP